MVELLAPIGDFEGLASAIKAGADAVYFGIKGLNMRTGSAKNFTIEDMDKVRMPFNVNLPVGLYH